MANGQDDTAAIPYRVKRLETDLEKRDERFEQHNKEIQARLEAAVALWNNQLERVETELTVKIDVVSDNLEALDRRAESVLRHYETRREDTRQLLNDAAKGIVILILGGVFATYILPLLHLASSGVHP